MSNNKLNASTLCVQPWIGAVISTNGASGICCEIGIIDKEHNIKTHNLRDFKSNKEARRLQEEMLAGEKPKDCNNCFAREEHGITSLRNLLNNNWLSWHKPIDFNFEENIENLEIQFSNICQLQCVMCHPIRSKKLTEVFNEISDEQPIFFENNKQHFLTHQKSSTQQNAFEWADDVQIFEKIADDCNDVKRLFLNGGEPLLSKAHNPFLQKLIDKGIAKNIELTYSTNILLITQEHVDLWLQFKKVSMSLSLDDIEERNRFIRYPSDWEKVNEKLQFIYKYNHILKLHIWRTITFLNLPYTIDFLEFFKSNYPKLWIHMRSIDAPQFLNPCYLPFDTKQKIITPILEYLNANNLTHLRSDILKILDSGNGEEANAQFLKDAIEYFEYLAKRRNFKLDEIFSKTYEYLK